MWIPLGLPGPEVQLIGWVHPGIIHIIYGGYPGIIHIIYVGYKRATLAESGSPPERPHGGWGGGTSIYPPVGGAGQQDVKW